jgi:hypothetical protein
VSERPKLLEQFQGLFIDPTDAATNAALHLFKEIYRQIGIVEARRIFLEFGEGPFLFGKDQSPKKLKKIKKAEVLDRYYTMKPRPNKAELARQLFAENQALPKGQRSITTLTSIEKRITRLIDERGWARSKRR